MRIVILTSQCHFAREALRAIVGLGVRPDVLARAGPAPRTVEDYPLAVAPPDPLAAIVPGARAVWLDPGDASAMAALAPDLILSVCFPVRISAPWRDRATLDCLNLHPSGLPAYRGPAPVFWQLRDGLAVMGVTLHRVVERLDAGPIVARSGSPVPAGASLAEAESLLAAAGASLVAGYVNVRGRRPEPTAQDETLATSQPWPAPADFALDPRWTAERAFRFMRGTRSEGGPFRIRYRDVEVLADRALALEPGRCVDPPSVPAGRSLLLPFADGCVRVTGVVRAR